MANYLRVLIVSELIGTVAMFGGE